VKCHLASSDESTSGRSPNTARSSRPSNSATMQPSRKPWSRTWVRLRVACWRATTQRSSYRAMPLAVRAAPETWWRDSNPRALLCRQLPGLSGTPRASRVGRLRGANQQWFRSLSPSFAALLQVTSRDARRPGLQSPTPAECSPSVRPPWRYGSRYRTRGSVRQRPGAGVSRSRQAAGTPH
jgi:hypothetical protein